MTLRRLWPALLLFALHSPVRADTVSTDELEAHIRFLADPLTEGRGLGTQGLEVAALYIESQFRAVGLQPAFGGSYRQPFEMLGITPDPATKLSLPGTSNLTYAEDFVAFTTRQDAPQLVEGELVYAGYLIEAPEREWDDIKGVDLKDKILLVEVNEPGYDQKDGLFEGPRMTYYGRWTYKLEQAAKLGARGVLLIHNLERATYGWGVVKNSWITEGFTVSSEYQGSFVEGWITEDVAGKVLASAGQSHSALLARAGSKEFRPVALGKNAQVTFRPRFRTVTTSNVGGLLPAAGPHRDKAPTVVLTAHYDHLGRSEEGDIFPGLVDNASAVSTLLALARYFSDQEALPVNLLFVAVSAEEQGLWGSRYLAANLPVDKERLWANINLEMTNIWGPTQDVYAIGADQSDLDAVAAEAARQVGLSYIAELDRENGFFYRSDQFSFARIGVPGVWLHEGPTSLDPADRVAARRKDYRARHYHQPSDSVEEQSRDWNLEGTRQIADWAIAMVRVLARAEKRPEFTEKSGFKR